MRSGPKSWFFVVQLGLIAIFSNSWSTRWVRPIYSLGWVNRVNGSEHIYPAIPWFGTFCRKETKEISRNDHLRIKKSNRLTWSVSTSPFSKQTRNQGCTPLSNFQLGWDSIFSSRAGTVEKPVALPLWMLAGFDDRMSAAICGWPPRCWTKEPRSLRYPHKAVCGRNTKSLQFCS